MIDMQPVKRHGVVWWTATICGSVIAVCGIVLLLFWAGYLVVGQIGATSPAPAPTSSSSTPVASSPPPAQHLTLTLVSSEYDCGDFGYVQVVGVAENDGRRALYSPTLVLLVFAEGVQVGEDTDWPTGQFLDWMEPGARCSFELTAHVDGEPAMVGWQVRAEDIPSNTIFSPD